MHDIKWIREHEEEFDRGLVRRGLPPEAGKLIALDERRRAAIQKAERDLAQQNSSTAQLDLLVVAAILNAHTTTRDGAEALTGPIARGDSQTVARHREALRARTPDLLALYDALAEVTSR